DVADGAVRRAPHLLEIELGHPRLVGSDGGALHPHPVPLDGVGRVDRDLVVRGVAVLDRQVVVLQRDVQVRQDQPLPDLLPDDPGHLVAVELDDRVGYLDLRHRGLLLQGVSCNSTTVLDQSRHPRRRSTYLCLATLTPPTMSLRERIYEGCRIWFSSL